MTFDSSGKLFLIPVPLGEQSSYIYSEEDGNIIRSIRHFIVENLKPAKRTVYYVYKERFKEDIKEFDAIEWYEINVLTPLEKLQLMRESLKKGWNLGLMSDAGCPAVADPGANMVRIAHELDMDIQPLIGPSSILLALMASGLGGQQFAFNGYLSQKTDVRIKQIRQYERESLEKHRTQLFIETPYRNDALFKDLMTHLSGPTLLSIAIDLTLPTQIIKTKTVEHWKKNPLVSFNKRPCLFSFLSEI